MTSNTEWSTSVDITQKMLQDILWSVPGAVVGRHASDLRRAVGDLSVTETIRSEIEQGTYSDSLLNCFTLARIAGATLAGTNKILTNLLATPQTDVMPVAVQILGAYFTLGSMSLIIADTTFDSREDVETVLGIVENSFNPSQDSAADEGDISVYQSIVALHSAVTRDLAERARPLPRIVPYSFDRRLPSLFVSQRLYYDGSRSEELIKENKTIHPLFMQNEGLALSA